VVHLACVNVDDLNLQLLLKDHPDWRILPAAVVSKDSPYGTILTVNARGKELGVSPGMRYAAGLSFTPELRAGTVSRSRVKEGVEGLIRCLKRFSPKVEAREEEPGIFWLDAAGLDSLYSSLRLWSGQILSRLSEEGFSAKVAVGFSRFGCYAAAKSAQGEILFRSPQEERTEALRAAIEVLPLAADVLQRLQMLGIRRVVTFLGLTAGGIRRRFGPDTEKMFHFAAGALELPLQPVETEEEPVFFQRIPGGEHSSPRILKYVESCLSLLLSAVQARSRLIRELRVSLVLDRGEPVREVIVPAAPAGQASLLLDLLGLRLEGLRLPDAVVAVQVSALTVSEQNVQAELFTCPSGEAAKQADKVFSRLRAAFGNNTVQRARLENEHLPERSYSWQRMDRLLPGGQNPQQGRQGQEGRRLVRRIFSKPQVLSAQVLSEYPGTLTSTALRISHPLAVFR